MKKYIIFLLILIGFICISTVSAADNATDDIVSSTQDVELKHENVEKVESNVHFKMYVEKYKVLSNKDFNYKVNIYHPTKYLGGIMVTVSIRDNGGNIKEHYIYTNSKGDASLKLNLPAGIYTTRFDAWVDDDEENDWLIKHGTIIVKDPKKTTDNNKIIKKSNVKTVNIKLKKNGITGKKLKTGDKLLAITNSGFGQYGRSINIGTLINVGQEGQHSTKLLKAKVYFKNKYTGKIIAKKAKAIKHNYNIKPLKWIDKLSPLKAKIWYKPR